MACCGNSNYGFFASNNIFNVNGITCGCGTSGFVASPSTSAMCCNVSAMQQANSIFDARIDRTAKQLIRIGGNVSRAY